VRTPPHFTVERPTLHWLTPRERMLMALVMRGLVNKQIADQLHLQNSTVANSLSGLFRKVGVSGRTELALWAFQNPKDAEQGKVRVLGIHQEGCMCGTEYCALLNTLGDAA